MGGAGRAVARRAQLLWIIDIYGFTVAGFLVTMCALGDRVGRRKLLLVGAAAFGLVSILSAISFTAEMLIVSRALLGIAGATIAPSTLSLIFNMFQDPGQRARAIAVWISAFSAGSAIGPIVGGVLLEYFHWGSEFLIALPVMGALLVLGPIVLLTQAGVANSLAIVITGSVIIALGLAPVLTLTTDLIVGSAPPERAGAASGISETAVELGGALGLSVLGSLGVAIYRGALADLPADLPPEAATTARDTLGGAVQVAATLPGQLGATVLDVSRDAFVQAMQVAATISAVLAVVVAIVAVASLRHVPSGGSTEGTAPSEEAAPRKHKVFTDMDCFGRTRRAVSSTEP